jgi:endonuclease G, mitochondrial
MKIAIELRSIIAETEKRYDARQDERREIKSKLEAGELLQADTPERVQKRLQRLGVERLTAEALIEGRLVPSVAQTASGFDLERIIRKNDLMRISYLEQGSQSAQSVGRIQIKDTNGNLVGYGTGFLVSPQLLMTNNHVLSSRREAASSQIEFNYQLGLDGKPLTSVFFDLDPNAFFITDELLDYTLVAVKGASRGGADLSSFGWYRLIEAEGKIIIGESVSIIQHPSGELKQVALRENQLIDVLPDFLHYQTDTAPGSSGSPVFNDQWEVVALHHSGVPERDSQGRILNIDGQVWREDDGEQRIAWKANEGVRISRIVKHIKAQSLSNNAKKLRKQMFEANPVRSAAPNVEVDAPLSVSVTDDGTATWTIPLQVSVRLGQPIIAATSPTHSINGNGSKSRQIEDNSLEAALTELREAARKPYYEQEQDEQDRDDYYGDLINSADSLDSDDLYQELSDLLRRTHRKKLSYKPSSHVYPWVDLHPDLKIRSIYSGQTFDPADLIREDFRTEQLRAAREQALRLRESNVTQEQYAQELALLEASLPYNCEHVVPQSWFNKAEPMRGDLHHLFACEVGCNSFRSNHPYIDFEDYEERDIIRDRCGKLSGSQFEPSKGKGAAARATLYFLLRYPGDIDDTANEYRAERIETLLAWHNEFPPTEYEKHRNAAIYEKQGNRNPLIDFPEWGDKIKFSLGLG